LPLSQVVRQTDGGSDNVGWLIHAFHFALVYFGVVNKLTWMRLPVGHSHNGADRKFSLVKAAIKTASGAPTPWDLEKAMLKGCKNSDGGAEVLWQLYNYDLETWLSEFVDKNVSASARLPVVAIEIIWPSRPAASRAPPSGCTGRPCAVNLWCLHTQAFAGYGHRRTTGEDGVKEESVRVWVYEYHPEIKELDDHGHVRIAYKMNIQD